MPAFGTSPKDNLTTPVSQVYVQNTANSDLTALRGVNKKTDSNSQNSAAAVVSMEDISASGSIVANAGTVVLALGLGISSWSVDLRGTFNAGTTLQFEGTIDNTNWFSVFGVPIGATTDVPVSSVVGGAALAYQGNAVGLQQFRVRASAFAGGDTVTVNIIGSVGMDGGFIDKAIPAGTNLIGAVKVTDSGGSNQLGVDASGRITSIVQAVAGTALAADQTNSILRMSNYGKNSTAGDTALKVNSAGDQYVLGDFTEQASLSAGGLNADLVASTDVSAYAWLSLQIESAYVGTLSFQWSNDNVVFHSLFLARIESQVSNSVANSTTSTGVGYEGPIFFRYLRVRMTSYTSGSATGTLELYTTPKGSLFTAVTASYAQPTTAGGTNDFHLISAATTNATSIKASSGQVYGYEIFNKSAATEYVKLYNKASAPTVGTDTPFRTIGVPAGGRASFHSSTGVKMSTGIALATTTGITDADNTAVALSDLAIEIDWV